MSLPPSTEYYFDALTCPLSRILPVDPVTAEDGRVYEREEIELYILTFASEEEDLVRSPIDGTLMGLTLSPAAQQLQKIEELIGNGGIRREYAFEWRKRMLLKKAREGDVRSMEKVMMNYFLGWDGFDQDLVLAYEWTKKWHAAGSIDGTACMGWFLATGQGCVKNFGLGTMFLGIAAAKGFQPAGTLLRQVLATAEEMRYGPAADDANELQSLLEISLCGGGFARC
jgi:TPR repeat protein